MNETPKFKPGDHVIWTSQAGGKSKTKQGIVYLTVPPDTALVELAECFVNQTFNVRADFASRRKHESYVIQIPGELRLYWPLVKYLKPIESIEEFEQLQVVEREDGTLKHVPLVNPGPDALVIVNK